MKARRDVYQAIADPTRRAIIHSLNGQTHNISALTGMFKISQQAVSLHVKILAECGLIQITQQGRERFCKARLDKLGEVSAWVDQYRKHWENKLDSLETYISQLKKERHGKQNK